MRKVKIASQQFGGLFFVVPVFQSLFPKLRTWSLVCFGVIHVVLITLNSIMEIEITIEAIV